jgi:tetratricopeptide (TPR) repeat protein
LEIKYSKKKQEIRQDPFMDFLAKAKEFSIARSNSLMGAGIVLCLLVAGFLVYGYLQRTGEAKAQDAFGRAMVAYAAGDERKAIEGFRTVVDNSKISPAAAYSAFLLGSMFLRQEKYDEAITWFTTAASGNAKAGFVAGDAHEGLADCYEAKGNRDEALKYLAKALEDPRLAYRFPAIEWKAALISKEVGRSGDAKRYCSRIVSDTTSQAAAFKQKAENLSREIDESPSK